MRKNKKILLLTGSRNQTSQMLSIANELADYDCWFSQMFTDSPVLKYLQKNTSLLNKTIIADGYRQQAEDYLQSYHCQIDYGAKKQHYDLVIFCSDLIVPSRLLQTKTIWVQEGMIDKATILSKLVRKNNLPPTLCLDTSLNGASNKCDLYCTASDGYRDYIAKMGTDYDKIFVTGLPNYDNAIQYTRNDFPHQDYVMVATTDMRETARPENRAKFIQHCVRIAAGRPLLFKLHPNENIERAVREIRKHTPADTLIYTEGNTHEMIANCCELITQYSTVVYTGIALGKKVHSWFDLDDLYRMAPLQNDGTSAKHIAAVCRDYIEFEGTGKEFTQQFSVRAPIINRAPEMFPVLNEVLHAG